MKKLFQTGIVALTLVFAVGCSGSAGTIGPEGPTGEKGATGAKGNTGVQGVQGDKGDKGDTGLQGIQGEKGDKGDPGTTITSIDGLAGGTITSEVSIAAVTKSNLTLLAAVSSPNEGGQLWLQHGSAQTVSSYIDSYKDALRVVQVEDSGSYKGMLMIDYPTDTTYLSTKLKVDQEITAPKVNGCSKRFNLNPDITPEFRDHNPFGNGSNCTCVNIMASMQNAISCFMTAASHWCINQGYQGGHIIEVNCGVSSINVVCY